MFSVIGTTTADLFVAGIERMPSAEGDEFTASSLTFCDRPLTMTLGGNGANSAYVLAALGAPVMLGSATGTDEIGALMAGWLATRGIDLRGLLRREAATATDTIVVDNRLNRTAFYYPGLFPTLGADDLPAVLWEDAHTLLITGYPLLPGFRAGGFALALERARARGLRTALDIGPAIGAPATLDELRPLLPLVDLLLANTYELSVATGMDDLEAGVRALQAAGAATVIVKLGSAGVFVHDGRAGQRVAGFPVAASVTVGAGDSFNAGLLFALQEGQPLADAAAFANATAALVVQTGRSVLGAPTAEQVRAFLRARSAA